MLHSCPADNAILFKLLAKTAGMGHGIMPSFMAKPYADVSLPSWRGLALCSD